MALSKLSIALISVLLVSNFVMLYAIFSLHKILAEQKSDFDNENSILVTKIQFLNSTVLHQQKNLSFLRDKLVEKNQELENITNLLLSTQEELNLTKQELEYKSSSLEETKEEFKSLKEEVEAVEQSISESMEWFNDNSHLPSSTSSFLSTIESECMDDGLNLACIEFFMNRDLGFTFKNENPDKLYSLSELLDRGGGDCEDYSLFLKAILNDLKEDNPDTELLGWEAGSGEFIIYENTKRQWYYDNAEQVSLGKLGDINPVVVCYTTFYSETQLRGHCVVALPEGDIGSSNDLEKLHGAKMFEPQTGEYLGEVDKNFSLCSGEDCGKSTNDIIIVISTNDFYKMESGSWQSFGLALDKIQNFKEKF